MSKQIISWLLRGDASIRYQTLRDLTDASSDEIKSEQVKIATEGWGARLLSFQDKQGTWAGGLYTPKWISTTYTLLLLKDIGLKQGNSQALKGCELLINKGFYKDGGINFFHSMKNSETCVTGMVLSLLCYFGFNDTRVDKLAEYLLTEQMHDGGWNCQLYRGATHSSFHTTINVLEGLKEYQKDTPCAKSYVKESIAKAVEFLLQHKLFKSHRTGKIVDEKMTKFIFPPRWRYDVMRALDFMQNIKALKDERFNDAIELIIKKQTKEGYWKATSPHSGKIWFEMEQPGDLSYWNTLRSLRILKWWEN